MEALILVDAFNIKDWESALAYLSNLGRELEVISLSKALIDTNIESSYLNFLSGRSYFYEKENKAAIKHLKRVIMLVEDTIEARNLLDKILANTFVLIDFS